LNNFIFNYFMHRPVTVFSAAFSEIGLKILQKKFGFEFGMKLG
jgi:hypothetical protein